MLIHSELGYHGFHPPRRHQEEDLLSDHNVKHGYSATHTIKVCILLSVEPVSA